MTDFAISSMVAPVMTTTGTSGEVSRRRRSVFNPQLSGKLRSRNTKSNESLLESTQPQSQKAFLMHFRVDSRLFQHGEKEFGVFWVIFDEQNV